MTSSSMPSPAALDSTLGAIIVGIIISLVLFGVMCVQAFTYYQVDFKNDPIYLKILVTWCCVFETIHTVLICIYIYVVCVTHFGDYQFLPVSYWWIMYAMPVVTFISAPVQIFFAFRIYALSRRIVYPAISTFASISRLGLTLASAVLAERGETVFVYVDRLLGLPSAAISLGAVVDVGNTISLCYYLAKGKNDITRSTKVIDTLTVWTIETGLLTSICMASIVILLGTMKTNMIWLCPLTFSANLYSNSLLASLNGRRSLRETLWSSHSSVILPNVQDTRETHIHFNISE